MAEIGVASSVIGIASVALTLALKLHDFSITTSAAGQQIAFIARNITNYADALELLGERVNDDDPIHSKRAVKLVNRLCRDSYDVFDKIETLIPEPKKGRDEISFAQKLAWNFKKGQVEYLAGQIECLKSTTNLLVSVLFAGKRIRARRRQRGKKARDPLVSTDVAREEARVSIAILEQVEAADRLAVLHAKVVEDNSLGALDAPHTTVVANTSLPTVEVAVPPQRDTMIIYQMPIAQDSRNGDRKQLVLQHTQTILQQLLDELTTCNTEQDNDLNKPAPANVAIPKPIHEVADRSRHVSQEPPALVTQSQETTLKPQEGSTAHAEYMSRYNFSQLRLPFNAQGSNNTMLYPETSAFSYQTPEHQDSASRTRRFAKLNEPLAQPIPSYIGDAISASRTRAKERHKAEIAAAAKKPPAGIWNSIMAGLVAGIDGIQSRPADERSRSRRPVRSRSSKTSHQRSQETPVNDEFVRVRSYGDGRPVFYRSTVNYSDLDHYSYYDSSRDAIAQLSSLNDDEC